MKKIIFILFLGLLLLSLASASTNFTNASRLYFSFDTNTNTDLSGNGFTNTFNKVYLQQGVLGRGLFLEPTGSSVSFNTPLNNSSPFTISAWIYPISVTSSTSRYIVSIGDNTKTGGAINIYVNATGHFNLDSPNIANIGIDSQTVTANTWNQLVATYNGSTTFLYLNNVNKLNSTSIINLDIASTGTTSYIGNRSGIAQINQDWIDEVGVWNRSLEATEINMLYNRGFGGNPFQISGLSVPAYNLFTLNNSQNFTGGFITSMNYSLANTTLFVWNSSGIVNQTFKIITGDFNYTSINASLSNDGFYLWNYYTCENKTGTTSCSFAPLNNTLIKGLILNSSSYNSTTYETAFEYYISKLTSLVTLSNFKFIFQDTLSSAIYSGDTVTASKEIPLNLNVSSWTFNFTVEGHEISLDRQIQNIGLINLSLCQAAPQNYPYLNFTFKNETSAQERVNASISTSNWVYWITGGSGATNKTFTYTNNVENKEYVLCFSPSNRTIQTELSLSYDNGESEQRTYAPSSALSLTNTSTLTTLFLLPTSQGQYVTFQVINTAQQALQGVQVVASRTGIGTIETGSTDSSGSVTMFLNPNFEYTFVFSKSGFTDFTTTITPTQTSYTITMGGTTGSTNSTNSAAGMSFIILPSQKTLSNDTSYNFNLTLNSSYWTLDSWGFTLQNRSGYIFTSQSSTASSGGFLSVNLNTVENKTIVMNYFWVINGVYNNATVTWGVIDLSGNGLSISQFFTDLRSYVSLGFFGLDDIGLGLITFFTIFLITGVMSYKFGINSPAAIMAFVFSLTMFFDIGLGLVPNPIGAIPHAPTFFMGIIMVALIFREMGR